MEHHHVQKVGQDYGGKKQKQKHTFNKSNKTNQGEIKEVGGSQQVVQGLAKDESNLDSTAKS